MANYETFSRSSYFYVTDKEKFRELVGRIEGAELWEDKDGRVAFGAYGDITYPNVSKEGHSMAIEDELQSFMMHNEACIITLIEHEKFSYITALCIVITRNNVGYISAQDLAVEKARELLCNPNKQFKQDY